MLPAVLFSEFTACLADSRSLQDGCGTPGHDAVMEVTPPQAKSPGHSTMLAHTTMLAHRFKPKNATLSSE